MTDQPDERMERARNANLWASLCRSHGCERAWVEVSETGLFPDAPDRLCLRHRADGPVLPLKVLCDTCGDERRVPWMIEADPHCYQERDEDGMVPCPDCVVRLSVPGVFAAARMVHHTTPAAHPPVPIFMIRPPDIDEQVYRILARKGIEVGQPASAAAIRSESAAAEPREPGRLASLLNARWKWWHGLHGHVSKHRGQATGETFYGCDRGHIARKRR